MRSASTSASATNSGEEGEDGDDYLLQQALASAKAIHHIHGIQFDELQDINVLTDIKFVVVSVPLPLGRKFFFRLIVPLTLLNNDSSYCVSMSFYSEKYCSKNTK